MYLCFLFIVWQESDIILTSCVWLSGESLDLCVYLFVSVFVYMCACMCVYYLLLLVVIIVIIIVAVIIVVVVVDVIVIVVIALWFMLVSPRIVNLRTECWFSVHYLFVDRKTSGDKRPWGLLDRTRYL